jgi:hypothetical protein
MRYFMKIFILSLALIFIVGCTPTPTTQEPVLVEATIVAKYIVVGPDGTKTHKIDFTFLLDGHEDTQTFVISAWDYTFTYKVGDKIMVEVAG